MNNRNIACLLAIVCGTLFGASLEIFAQGSDAWAGTGVTCAIGTCMALGEIAPSL
jgi:hypothetical protein